MKSDKLKKGDKVYIIDNITDNPILSIYEIIEIFIMDNKHYATVNPIIGNREIICLEITDLQFATKRIAFDEQEAIDTMRFFITRYEKCKRS